MNTLQNYLKVAFRNLLRHKSHSIINIVGLSIGMCFSLLILLYVLFELSFDNFHRNGKQIYLLPMTWHFNGTDLPTSANCTAGGPFMKEAFSQVENTVRIKSTSLPLKKENEVIKEPRVYFADSSFFQIFTFPFIIGNPKTSLIEPNSIVLTKSMAVKYFGQNWQQLDLLNKTITGSNNKLYKITGIVSDVPFNSHLQFDFVVSLTSLPIAFKQYGWDNSEFFTYVVFNPQTNIQKVLSDIPGQLEKKFGAWAKDGIGLDLVPLQDIYLRNLKYKLPNTSDILYINIFIAIAVLILVVATFNYINLSTARSMERALEVGVRKVMGAVRTQLFYQFMIESTITTGISLSIGLALTKIALPAFNNIIGTSADIRILSFENGFLIVTGCLLISLSAGIYPALVLSNYKPVKVLKGKLKDSLMGIRLRKILVITQFSISVILIISALTISGQLKFIQAKDLGYNREGIVAISLDSLSRTRIENFKVKALNLPWVTSLSASLQLPVNMTSTTAASVQGSEERRLIAVAAVEADFLTTLDIKPIAGTDFAKNADALLDTWEIILNESALNFYGWTVEEAIGKKMTVWETKGVVKGVVKNFHYTSLHNPINPLIIFTGKGLPYANMLIRCNPEFPVEGSDQLTKLWKEVNPDSPFILTHLADKYNSLYRPENRMSNIINLFTFLAAFISGLGLFGLASYSILQRTKELGIRKVVGASTNQLIVLVSNSFVRHVLTSFIFACPISYFLMNQWLNGFTYKIEFSWLFSFVAGIITLALTLMTVTYHAFQVARNNPVKSLRSE